jgi:AmmeMemoRadiSam system protein B
LKRYQEVAAMPTRQPAVAGMFYQASGLREEIESCFLTPGGPGRLPDVNPSGPRKIVGLVSPHAGLVYSGMVAAHAYLRLAEDGLPQVAVIMGPNHRAYLPAVALSDDSTWRTPLGETVVDAEIARRIAAAYPMAEFNNSAHASEHSLEVQLPFLQYIGNRAGGNSIRIVPILIGAASPGGEVQFAREFGAAIADALQGEDAVIIASTDFTHYESSQSASSKDSLAMSCIEALDEAGLIGVVQEHGITMCGVLPTAVMIAAAKRMGATAGRTLAYRDSGDVTGDHNEVVGYGALEILR